jgi:hypothetical protein
MSEEWQYQVRIDLPEAAAGLARRDPAAAELQPLGDILVRHRATLTSQYDAFAGYVAEAEREGIEHYPLYAWTKQTIENPAKKAKYLKNFTFYLDDREVYPQAQADALIADLQPLVDAGLIVKISRYDTNPANNPQPPARSDTEGRGRSE